MFKKFGALPFIGGILLLGIFMAVKHNAAEKPGTAGKPMLTGIFGSLFKTIGGSNTQATIYKSEENYPPEMTMGLCLYCRALLAITGDKGSDSIRCPNCGGTITAIKAILYLDYSNRQGH
jgi:DNA-directed RNA polymerase subunit RPC12/RpoP